MISTPPPSFIAGAAASVPNATCSAKAAGRASASWAAAGGCRQKDRRQLIAVRKAAYVESGGHAAFKSLLHDGLHLPRKLRAAGFATGLADLTDVSSTRMYTNRADLEVGLMKNAHEAMATSVGLPVWTVMLGFGQVLPILLLILVLIFGGLGPSAYVLAVAILCGFGLRLVLALRFNQSMLGVALHPVSVAALLRLQWHALINRRRGGKVTWKGRQY